MGAQKRVALFRYVCVQSNVGLTLSSIDESSIQPAGHSTPQRRSKCIDLTCQYELQTFCRGPTRKPYERRLPLPVVTVITESLPTTAVYQRAMYVVLYRRRSMHFYHTARDKRKGSGIVLSARQTSTRESARRAKTPTFQNWIYKCVRDYVVLCVQPSRSRSYLRIAS